VKPFGLHDAVEVVHHADICVVEILVTIFPHFVLFPMLTLLIFFEVSRPKMQRR
jgi:hypothetical protein